MVSEELSVGAGGACGVRRWRWRADRVLRAPMRSSGRPPPSREVQREFGRLIASGAGTEGAGAWVGVLAAVVFRWFRHVGGMTPVSLKEPTGRCLCFRPRTDQSTSDPCR